MSEIIFLFLGGMANVNGAFYRKKTKQKKTVKTVEGGSSVHRQIKRLINTVRDILMQKTQ